jgi:putative ABC transport system permease protein
MRALDIKMFRDLGRLWAQALAIALVMACGVATLILAVGVHGSLEQTRQTYYERFRFGDVFAAALRAPDSLAASIARIDGVVAVEPRIEHAALLDVVGFREPATGRLISLPKSGHIAVNAVQLHRSRLPESGRGSEVAVNVNFAKAHGFSPGSTLDAIVGSSKITFTIVGTIYSPEFVYALGPGDMMPDDRRFGVLWVAEETLAALLDLDGAFNSVSLRLLPGTNVDTVIDRLDTLLEAYGGTGAYARKDQQSNAFLDSELNQLGAMATIIPPIFLAISAFLINMILARLISLEREQIGLLKALGYARLAVVGHYLKLVLVIAAAGIIMGAIAGTWLGHGMTVLYGRFYSFPFLLFTWDPAVYLIAAGVTVAAAVVGALQAIRTAFSLPAAVAMRPPAPTVYREFMGGLFARLRIFSELTVMALRHLLRHPVRTLLTAVGTSFSVGLLTMALGTIASIDYMVEAVFFRSERQHASLQFGLDLKPEGLAPVGRLPGVLRAEPYLTAPVRMTLGQFSRQLSITGKPPHPELSRVLDINLNPVVLPEGGLVIGDRTAAILGAKRGDLVQVDFLDGPRRKVEVPVADVIKSYLGLTAYMDIDALARLAGTGPRISGAHILVDDASLDQLYRAVKATPQVESIALQEVSRRRFEQTMDENIMIMLSVYVTLSVIIAFGVVYNSARIQLSERARELATLRVLGFARSEVANVLFVEIGTTVALAQPLGWLVGMGFITAVTRAFETDLFRVPLVFDQSAFAMASIIVLASALVSALIVRRRINRLDLVRVLKSRE